jgi:hypothetical protein
VNQPGHRVLNDMREFVAEQLLPLHAIRLIATGREINVSARCKGQRSDLFRLWTEVYAHSRKIGTECRFHFAAHVVRQRSSPAVRQSQASWIDFAAINATPP